MKLARVFYFKHLNVDGPLFLVFDYATYFLIGGVQTLRSFIWTFPHLGFSEKSLKMLFNPCMTWEKSAKSCEMSNFNSMTIPTYYILQNVIPLLGVRRNILWFFLYLIFTYSFNLLVEAEPPWNGRIEKNEKCMLLFDFYSILMNKLFARYKVLTTQDFFSLQFLTPDILHVEMIKLSKLQKP